MFHSPAPNPSRNRRKPVWKAIDDGGQIWLSPSIAQLYRRILVRNELLKNIAASPGNPDSRS